MIGQCIHDIATSYGLPMSLFMAGLVGGFTHCAVMCSPFVLAQIGVSQQKSANKSKPCAGSCGGCGKKDIAKKVGASFLLPYHLGRMTTYVILAVLVSSVLNLAFVFSGLKALIAVPMLVAASVIFLVSAFPQLLSIFPWVVHMRVSMPYRFIESAKTQLTQRPNGVKRYALGVLLGFMPCGLVVSALLAAATADTALQSGMAMAAFTLGTIPALVLVALGGQTILTRYPKASVRLKQTAMVLSSLWLCLIAGTMIF